MAKMFEIGHEMANLATLICIPTITEHLVVVVQPHHFNNQSQCNQLGAFTKS